MAFANGIQMNAKNPKTKFAGYLSPGDIFSLSPAVGIRRHIDDAAYYDAAATADAATASASAIAAAHGAAATATAARYAADAAAYAAYTAASSHATADDAIEATVAVWTHNR